MTELLKNPNKISGGITEKLAVAISRGIDGGILFKNARVIPVENPEGVPEEIFGNS